MTPNYTEVYISERELQTRFRIAQAYKPDFGKFVVIRWLYSINANGGHTWQRLLFYLLFTFTLSPLAFAADITGLVIYGALLIAKKFIEGLALMLLTVCKRFLGTVATIAAAIGAILLIYYQWDIITNFVKGLF